MNQKTTLFRQGYKDRGIKNNKYKIFFLFFASLFLLNATMVYAMPTERPVKTYQQRCEDFEKMFNIVRDKPESNAVKDLPRFCTFGELILYAIRIALNFAGIVAVLFIIVGGYWYLTSAGNEEQAEKGRKTLTNSIIGLVIIILSSVIVRVVSNALVKDQGGTGSTSSNTATTTSPTNNATSGSLTDSEIAVLTGSINISQKSNKDVTVTAQLLNNNEADLAKKACGVNSPTAAALRVEFEGKLVGQATRFSQQGPTTYSAVVNLPASTFQQSGSLIAYICNTEIKMMAIQGGN